MKKTFMKTLSFSVVFSLTLLMIHMTSIAYGNEMFKTIDGTKEIVPLIGNAEDPCWEVLNPTSYSGGSGYTPATSQVALFGENMIQFSSNNYELRAAYMNAAIGEYGYANFFGNIGFRYNCANKDVYIDFTKDTLRADLHSTLAQNRDVNYPYKVVLNFEGITEGLPISFLTSTNLGYTNGRYTAEVDLNTFMNQSWATTWKTTIEAAGGKLKLISINFLSSLQYYGTSGASFFIYDLYLESPTLPVLAPIGPHDDVQSMWETEYEPYIYAGINDTEYPLYVNTNVDENGVITAARSAYCNSPVNLQVPARYFQGEKIDLTEDMQFYFDFTARSSSWKMALSFYEEGYVRKSYTIYLTKQICIAAGITGKALTDFGDSGTYQGSIDLRTVINEYGLTSMVDSGQSISTKTIQFTKFSVYFNPVDTATHLLQLRHLSFGHGTKSFPTAPDAASISIPQSKFVMQEMDAIDICPSASSSGWRVLTKTNPTVFVPQPATQQLATVTDTVDGKVAIKPTLDAIGTSGFYGTLNVRYELDEPIELKLGTDWLRFDLDSTDNWIIVLYGQVENQTTSFRISSLVNRANDWCSIKSVHQDYQFSNFSLISRNLTDAFGAYYETLTITRIVFSMSLDWTNSPGVNMTIGELSLLTPKDNSQLVEDRISALSANGRVITTADYDEVQLTKQMYDKLTIGEKASISEEMRMVLKKAVTTAMAGDYDRVALTGTASGNWEVLRPLSGTGYDYSQPYVPASLQTSVMGSNYMTFTDIGAGSVEALYQTAAIGHYGTGLYGAINFRYNHKNSPIPIDFKCDKILLNVESALTLNVGYPFTITLYFDGYSEGMVVQLLRSPSTANMTVIDGQYYIEYDLSRFLNSNWLTPYVNWRERIKVHDGVLKLKSIVFRQEITYNGDAGIHMKIFNFSLLKPDT